jgi:hypothetical protein
MKEEKRGISNIQHRILNVEVVTLCSMSLNAPKRTEKRTGIVIM